MSNVRTFTIEKGVSSSALKSIHLPESVEMGIPFTKRTFHPYIIKINNNYYFMNNIFIFTAKLLDYYREETKDSEINNDLS